MVDAKSWAETVSVMAIGAVAAGYRVCRYRGRFGGCVNAIGFIVAGFTGLYRCIHAVVEDAPHIEAGDAMAYVAIDDCQRMTIRLTDRRNTVA